jgi:hypothetical protein
MSWRSAPLSGGVALSNTFKKNDVAQAPSLALAKPKSNSTSSLIVNLPKKSSPVEAYIEEVLEPPSPRQQSNFIQGSSQNPLVIPCFPSSEVKAISISSSSDYDDDDDHIQLEVDDSFDPQRLFYSRPASPSFSVRSFRPVSPLLPYVRPISVASFTLA